MLKVPSGEKQTCRWGSEQTAAMQDTPAWMSLSAATSSRRCRRAAERNDGGPEADQSECTIYAITLPPSPPLVIDTFSAKAQASLLCGFDFVAAPLVHPRYRRPAPQALPQGVLPPPFTRSDLLLTSSQWTGQVRHSSTNRRRDCCASRM